MSHINFLLQVSHLRKNRKKNNFQANFDVQTNDHVADGLTEKGEEEEKQEHVEDVEQSEVFNHCKFSLISKRGINYNNIGSNFWSHSQNLERCLFQGQICKVGDIWRYM